jgi:transketolase
VADEKIVQLAVNTIRTLSMDAVQQARSGHPGTPMALAPVAYCLWQHFLRFDPQDPIWPNRDRFILSAGHASMLLYALLHLTGVKGQSVRIMKRWVNPRCRWRPSNAFGSSTAAAPATPSTAGPVVLRRQPARSARGWPTVSAWLSPAAGWRPTSIAPASRI